MIGLEKIDALLDLSQDFSKLLWVLDCFVVIKDVSALFLVLVMKLVFLDFAHDASQDVFTIEDDHTCLLEVPGAGLDHSFVVSDALKVVCVQL